MLSRAATIFTIALVVVSVHLAVAGAGVALAVAAVLAAAFAWLRPGPRAWVAFVAGAAALADGGIHASRPSGDAETVTGIAAGLAGAALIALAARIAARPKAPRRASVRWAARVGVAAGTLATIVFAVMPIGVAVYLLHKPARHVPTTALAIPHRDVTLRTADGVDLAAWYVPSRNGAAVVLVHGAGGDRMGGIEGRATMLARHGFGVLLYDERGAGDSGGRPESMGWTWHRDAAAAVDYLHAQGVARVGALGLSTGAETVLESAGRDPRIDAVVAEGAQARSFAEMSLLPQTATYGLYRAYWGATVLAYRALSRESPSPSLATMVERIAPRPVLLISSGTGFERDLNRAYARHARGPLKLWELPAAQHTAGLSTYPEAYDRRVTGFFDRALLR